MEKLWGVFELKIKSIVREVKTGYKKNGERYTTYIISSKELKPFVNTEIEISINAGLTDIAKDIVANTDITTEENCLKVFGKDLNNRSMRVFYPDETFFVKDDKIYRKNGLFGLIFVAYNDITE